jgi:hypothetical protein
MDIEKKGDKTCTKCTEEGIGSSENRKFIV